jgi:hypothetical protein
VARRPSPLPPAPSEAISPAGEPRYGAFSGTLERVGLLRAAPPGLAGRLWRARKEKRWTYLFAAWQEAMVAAAVVEAGWFAAGFAWVLDRTRGALAFDRAAAGLPGVHARVDDGFGEGARAHFSGAGLRIEIVRRGPRHELSIGGRGGFEAEVVLEGAGAPSPSVLITPVAGPGVRVTQKAGGLGASGTLALDGRTFALEGGSGGVDSTHGFLARETAWRWAFGTGRLPDDAPIAFNLAEGFSGVPEGDPGENALYLREATARLPPVRFTFDRQALLSPWRVASAEGSVELAFTPAAVHREVKNLVLLRTRFAQVPGTFSGRLPGPNGPVEVAALPGVVEDHWAVW